jgi:pimeloyl-ACP methyl ester carboxylesterase
VLFHGFPGNERNLDLAQAIRRAGRNVVFFHYRGAWGSGGLFSFTHVLDDVAAVIERISDEGFAAAHRIDPDRIALVGHSMGGFAALTAGAESARVDCIVSLAGANLGALANGMQADPSAADRFAERLDSWSGPIRGVTGRELVDELIEQADRFDTIRSVEALASRRLLLIAGEDDVVTPPAQNHTPLVDALKRVGAASLVERIIPRADHSFSGQRIALARIVSYWLVETCESPR